MRTAARLAWSLCADCVVDTASAKVSVRETAGFYQIRLANVLADPEAIRQALRRGLNVRIQFIPSSPSLVDKEVVSYETPGGDRRVRWSYRPASSVEGDLVTVRVPLDYQGELGIVIGRRVRPGEALHCAGVEGKRIRDILPILQQRHLRARWHLSDQGKYVPREQVLDWWVAGTSPWAPGEVMISAVHEQPDLSGLNPDYLTRMRQGCPVRLTVAGVLLGWLVSDAVVGKSVRRCSSGKQQGAPVGTAQVAVVPPVLGCLPGRQFGLCVAVDSGGGGPVAPSGAATR
jgi:hypothetical protein